MLMGTLVFLGALMLWRIASPLPAALFGTRSFEGKVVSVDRRLDRTLVVVKDKTSSQKIQLALSSDDPSLPGDVLAIEGTVEVPQDFLTDNGRLFGYHDYLQSKGVVGVMSSPTVTTIASRSFSLLRLTTTIRYSIAAAFTRYLSFPFDGIVAGMTVGYQGGIPQAVQDLFRNTGVLHVLVLSGYNITLLAGFLSLLLRGVSFRLRTAITIVAVVLLVLISGAGVAAIRAGIMGSIALLAGLSLKTYRPLRALCVAYVCFFCFSPRTLFVDPGFHLSFLATFFMVALFPKVEKLFSFIPTTRYVDLRELCVLAFTIPLFMLPYTMYFSGLFPLASPLANSLFAIITPFIMIGGMILFALSWMVPWAHVVGRILSLCGSGVMGLLQLSARLPLWNTPAIPWWVVSGVYSIALAVLFRSEISAQLLHWYSVLRRQTS